MLRVLEPFETTDLTRDDANSKTPENMQPCPRSAGKNLKPTDKIYWPDKVFQSIWGLREFPNCVAPRVLDVSVLFRHPTVRAIDVGWIAVSLSEDGTLPGRSRWDRSLCVRGCARQPGWFLGEPLRHGALLSGGPVYCEALGARWLNVDYWMPGDGQSRNLPSCMFANPLG